MLVSGRSNTNPLFAKGVIIMIIAGLVLSTGGPIIRNISDASGFQIVFWRSVSQSIFVLLFLLIRNGRTTFTVFIDIGHSGVIASLFWVLHSLGLYSQLQIRQLLTRCFLSRQCHFLLLF